MSSPDDPTDRPPPAPIAEPGEGTDEADTDIAPPVYLTPLEVYRRVRHEVLIGVFAGVLASGLAAGIGIALAFLLAGFLGPIMTCAVAAAPFAVLLVRAGLMLRSADSRPFGAGMLVAGVTVCTVLAVISSSLSGGR